MRVISEQTKSDLCREFASGKGVRAAARAVGVSTQTARRYFRQLGAVPNCRCGLPVTHQGWCPVRYAGSARRQKFLHGVEVVSDERCEMCRDAGFPDILAHYKGVSAGGSNTGKSIPSLCFDHKHGRVPKHLEKLKQEQELRKSKDEPAAPAPVPDRPTFSGKARQDAKPSRIYPPEVLVESLPGRPKYEVFPNLCSRGCGNHRHRGSCKGMSGVKKASPMPKPIGTCLCGCGEPTNRGYIWGHKTKTRPPQPPVVAASSLQSDIEERIKKLQQLRDLLNDQYIAATVQGVRL